MGPTGPAGTADQDAIMVAGSASVDIVAAPAAWTLVPGLEVSINIPENSKVLVSTDGGALTWAGAGGFSVIDLALFVDGGMVTDAAWRRITAMNLAGIGQVSANWSFRVSLSLPAGIHKFEVKADVTSGVDARLSGNSSSINQGQLTVVILKQ
jgi:hypothetical protein